ncbi:MAG TPA: hypothetical protein VN705_23870 [Steroidobacteraceae bacterium]|jgi:hypothetical protein|nr:hypothetical protein [Steroidobacteraceae bacterium]
MTVSLAIPVSTTAAVAQEAPPKPKVRDTWDKVAILLDPIGKILAAVVVVLIGIYGNRALQTDQKRRAYVELLSRREESDGNLRKDMFSKVIEVFIGKNDTDLDARILNLELLAYNFHESIDFAPLLKHVYEQTWTGDNPQTYIKQRKRLRTLAGEIVHRQLVALSYNDCSISVNITFDELKKEGVKPEYIKKKCPARPGLPAREFSIDVMTNPVVGDIRRETAVDVVMRVQALDPTPSATPRQQERPYEFTVGPFDFPLIDNVRLSDRGRAALAMTRVDDSGATIVFSYFPDTRTSLRDKPFQDEVMRTLELQ